jgi:tellurium resistance protein TerD
MSGFNLEKGSSFNLSKELPSLKVAGVGLGWNTDADLDVSAFCVGEDDHIPAMTDLVYFNSELKQVLDGEDAPRPYSTDGGVYGAIDELEGDDDDDGDDEDMWIYFDRIADNIKEVVVVITIHQEGNKQTKFNEVSGCYGRIWDQESNKELCRYTLGNEFGACDAVEVGKFKRSENGWSFEAIGKGHDGGLLSLIKKYAYRF